MSWTCETKFEYDDKRDWFTDNLADAIRISKKTSLLSVSAIFRDSKEGAFGDEDNNDRYTWITLFQDHIPDDTRKIKLRFKCDSDLYFVMFGYTFRDLSFNSGHTKEIFNGNLAINFTINIEQDRNAQGPWRY